MPARRFQGWPFAVQPRPWADVLAHYDEGRHPQVAPLTAIVRSVIESEAGAALAATTSMFDLIVVSVPVPEPPFGIVRVGLEAPRLAPRVSVPPGHVCITHESGTGRDDIITRPPDEAVALFWRFMIEKFGVHPGRGVDHGQ